MFIFFPFLHSSFLFIMALISSSGGYFFYKRKFEDFLPAHSKGGLHATFLQDVTFRFSGERHKLHKKRMSCLTLAKAGKKRCRRPQPGSASVIRECLRRI